MVAFIKQQNKISQYCPITKKERHLCKKDDVDPDPAVV